MYCRNCGNKLAEDAKFCKMCGAAVRSGGQQEGAAPAPSERPVPAAKPAQAAKPTQAAKPVLVKRPVSPARSASDAAKIDWKLIAAVAVFLALQLVVVIKVVSTADQAPAVWTDPSASAGEGITASAEAYFGQEIRVGGKVEFGSYEQDGNLQNGPEPIVWDVVESFEDGYLLVSRYILDGMPWDDGSGSGSTLELKTEITYEQCSMRRWIRDTFAEEAFTEEERALIIPVSVKGDDILAKKDNQYATDCAFILREDEVMDYWGKASPSQANASLACAPTEYATWSGLDLDTTVGRARYQYGSSSCTAPWALRRRYTDTKSSQAKIVTVATNGSFSNAVVSETLGFRPAIYIMYG